jgi:cytochrome c oxidase subunit 2
MQFGSSPFPFLASTFPVFEPASPQARAIHELFIQVLVISAVIFTIVAGLIVIALIRGRKLSCQTPEQNFGSHKAEIAWMVGPVIVLFWIAAISAKLILTLNAVPRAHPDREMQADAELTVTGHQWWWEVQYADSGVVGANEVHLPAGRKVRVLLRSDDVIHCFWVPRLARKMDCIPGRDNYIWLEADEPGVYQGRCAEYCGTQHAWMNFKVYVHTPADFERWLAGHKVEPPSPSGSLAEAGKDLFMTATCVNCHTIEGTPAKAMIGPDLTHLAGRQELGGGVIENTPDNLATWLKNPQALKPGCKMPNFKLDDQQIQQLVSYLETLK